MPWGRAGERISEEEAARRRAARRKPAAAAAAVVRPENDRRLADARRAWEAGLVRPYLLSLWMNHRGVEGPEVDAACGVPEPTVDLWEEGRVYPTWDQLLALATFCELPVWRFTEDVDTTRTFLCARSNRAPVLEPERIRAFDPLALAAAGIQPYPEPGQGRLL